MSALDARLAGARSVADAVLYEGYVLYPYRASAKKNQVRWQFGVVAPAPYCATDLSESSSLCCELLVETRAGASLAVRLRALQVQARTVEIDDGAGGFAPAPSLEVAGEVWTSFDEAIEREADVVDVDLGVPSTRTVEVDLPAGREMEEVAGGAGRLVRERFAVHARITVDVEPLDGPYPLCRARVTVDNTTDWAGPAATRGDLVRRSLVAAHLLAAVEAGRFVSLLDPPAFAAAAAAGCTNVGVYPVLVGDAPADDSATAAAAGDVVLASPIILYDHPVVAPESEGDLCDATEIDEILALRVLTLTDDEKREARATDPRAAAIVDRCDAMGPDAFASLHGTFRSIRSLAPAAGDVDELPWWEPAVDAAFDPWTDTVAVGGEEIGKGRRVRLRPGRRADAQDAFLAGRSAEVAGVFHEVDGGVYVAVTVDDDPGADLHQWHGRYLYFHPDEVEVLP